MTTPNSSTTPNPAPAPQPERRFGTGMLERVNQPASSPAAPPRGLAVKLCEVMALVDEVPKRGWNDFHKYHYATESDITAAVRSALAERHVLVLPRLESVEWGETPRRNGGADRLCTTRVAFDFTDADSGEVITVVMVGQGSDAGDKAFYKAVSGALKYVLLKTFLMSTGNDDPEHEGAPPASGQQQPRRSQQQRPSAPTPAKDSPEARATFLRMLEEAKTAPEVAAAGKFATAHLSKDTRDDLRTLFNAALARVTGKNAETKP